MRILHISSEATWRGGEQQIAYLIQESMSRGQAVEVLCKSDSAFQNWCEEQSIPYRTAPFKNSFDLYSAWKLRSYIRDSRIDLIHIHSGKGHGVFALSTLLGVRTPAILSRRVDFPLKNNPWSRWKYGLSQIKHILCVSDAIRALVLEKVSDPERVSTIHSGIDLSRFEHLKPKSLHEQYDIPRNRMLIGNVAALAPHKDYRTFIRTAERCVDSGLPVHFFIIGEGDERSMIESEISRSGLQSHVTMTGFLQDIPAVLAGLDLFLISSETEGLGTSILDAFAAGTPVIATAAGGIPEIVIHEQTGLLCPIKDDQCLAFSVKRLLDDTDLKERLRIGATEHLQQFTKQTVAQQTLAVYEEVLSALPSKTK
ncbi:MAG: glycosyltransferase [Flavobacteriales bacterium]|nr:glycosyltransferase [Flavobacteriales bacterium]